MATSAVKKRKTVHTTDVGNPSPIVPIRLACPGLGEVDTRIVVFKKEFHVHSTILKVYSGFFHAFLDSPEKAGHNSTSARALLDSPEKVAHNSTSTFRYDYISVVDEDGTWGLEPVAMTTKKNKSLEIPEPMMEEHAFKCVLKAMYMMAYEIVSTKFLERIVALADFYRALPAVSTSINTVLWQSKDFQNEMMRENVAPRVLICAKKLRNTLLFREAFTLVICPCFVKARIVETLNFFEEDKDLSNLVLHEYLRINELALKAIGEVFADSSEEEVIRAAVKRSIHGEQCFRVGAGFMRRLHHALNDIISPLIGTTSMIQSSLLNEKLMARLGYCCAEISDKDLPWDQNEASW
ncbi:hypothetical protein PVAG01_02064 [Phlyctema vagabunda]|uniref:BTB domain-containing protein n=1 Tax=Phlyctema vagabunda TaxID=108571 RepID=A0ABR4PQ06_9HELO